MSIVLVQVSLKLKGLFVVRFNLKNFVADVCAGVEVTLLLLQGSQVYPHQHVVLVHLQGLVVIFLSFLQLS